MIVVLHRYSSVVESNVLAPLSISDNCVTQYVIDIIYSEPSVCMKCLISSKFAAAYASILYDADSLQEGRICPAT